MEPGVGSPDELTTAGADEVIATRRSADQPSPVPPAPRRSPLSAVVIVGYLLIGVVAFWPVYPRISHHLFGVGEDFTQRLRVRRFPFEEAQGVLRQRQPAGL